MWSQDAYDGRVTGLNRFDRRDRGVLQVTGTDRVDWLQGLVTNDVRLVTPGHRVYAAWLTPQGRMITDLWLVGTDAALLLDVPAPLASSLAARLDGLVFSENVQVTDVSATMPVSEFIGATDAHGVSVSGVAVRSDVYGRPSVVVYGPWRPVADEQQLPQLREAEPSGLEALDVLRIESGVPAFGRDMDTDTIPLEAGLESRAISFTKGCYVGQELIVRVTQRGGGRVVRHLVGLQSDRPLSPDLPLPRDVQVAGRSVGRLTSTAVSSRLGCAVALATLHRDHLTPGHQVEVADTAGPITARVVTLPMTGHS
ncbi:MAG: folate-binding protein YgfZ [Acidobacteria bacterium]|nr:folate-binding protein YgfZ [Acidobacteriota bacterium]